MKGKIGVVLLWAVLLGCRKDAPPAAVQEAGTKIVVFIPGVMAGSPIYEMLAQGVKRAAEDFSRRAGKVEVTVIEGGFNQAEWEPKLTALAAGGRYDLIVSSNPSLPAIAEAVAAKFPRQRFMLLNGRLEGNPQIYTLEYNQWDQGYLAGYLAGLLAAGREGPPRVGLLAGQEYPDMLEKILPAYEAGARAAAPEVTVDFRVVGNWFDAGKAAELGAAMLRGGAAALLCVAGGANEGALQAAAEAGGRVIWFDTNGYSLRPGIVAGSAVLYQDKGAYEKTLAYLEGRLPFGTVEVLGAQEGYVDFIEDDPDYVRTVPPEIREKQAAMARRVRAEGAPR